MTKTLPETRSVDLSDFQADPTGPLADIKSGEWWLVLEQGGKPAAALVSLENLEQMRLDREWREGTRIFEEIGARFEDVPLEELEAKIAEIIATNRESQRIERESS
jgi:hypothetical protein